MIGKIVDQYFFLDEKWIDGYPPDSDLPVHESSYGILEVVAEVDSCDGELFVGYMHDFIANGQFLQ